MTRTPATRNARLVGLCQIGVGVLLALRPGRVAQDVAGPSGRAAPHWLVQVLGVRSLVQGLVTVARPTGTVLAVGALVDATHALSMAPVIAWMPRYRRAAGASALAATVSATVAVRSADRRRPGRMLAS